MKSEIVVILEDVYQLHNANSVIRTCENLAVKDLYVIEKINEFKPDKNLSHGAVNHIRIHKFKNIIKCLNNLKSRGFTIVATTPHENDYELNNLPMHPKMAILFGSEEKGITQDAIDNSDLFMKIPMYGFTESLNISVCVAITLFNLSERVRLLHK